MTIKEELYRQCELVVGKRLQNIEHTIQSHQKGLQSETKSSAGDKHETGRAMLQLEMEKASQQFNGVAQMKEVLAKLKTQTTSKNEVACLGSIVSTTSVNYFISISIGLLKINNINYFAISPSSPIGQLILGKKEGETFMFKGNVEKIKKII